MGVYPVKIERLPSAGIAHGNGQSVPLPFLRPVSGRRLEAVSKHRITYVHPEQDVGATSVVVAARASKAQVHAARYSFGLQTCAVFVA
ncbi:MAG: hypothetical protein ACOCVP_05110 [Wenzhouxiangella sp.]